MKLCPLIVSALEILSFCNFYLVTVISNWERDFWNLFGLFKRFVSFIGPLQKYTGLEHLGWSILKGLLTNLYFSSCQNWKAPIKNYVVVRILLVKSRVRKQKGPLHGIHSCFIQLHGGMFRVQGTLMRGAPVSPSPQSWGCSMLSGSAKMMANPGTGRDTEGANGSKQPLREASCVSPTQRMPPRSPKIISTTVNSLEVDNSY